MSTQQQITRIETARNTIRNKMVDLGIGLATDKLDALATKLESVENRGAVTVNVKEGETYTIPKGYHNGTGTVAGIAGGGNYTLQEKSVTPSKSQQNITSDDGYYGLSGVTVAPIPDAYQDVTSVDAVAADVLANKKIVSSTGEIIAGTMPNNVPTKVTLNQDVNEYTIPKGYHDGTGVISAPMRSEEVTPSKAGQVIGNDGGTFLSGVTVKPIPNNYGDITGLTASSAHILSGQTALIAGGDDGTVATKVTGSMKNNGAASFELNTDTDVYTIPEGYHDGTGKVTVLAISETVTPSEEEQFIAGTTDQFLRRVTVKPVPDNWGDATGLTAIEANILAGKTAIVEEMRDGKPVAVKVTGAMINNPGFDHTLTTGADIIGIQQGYHDGAGSVRVSYTSKTVTPTKSEQFIEEPDGKFYSSVTVEPIPDAYQDVTGVTATADKVLTGSAFVDSTGKVVNGTMANHGGPTVDIDGLTQTSYTIPKGYHDGTGVVVLDNSIETLLASI